MYRNTWSQVGIGKPAETHTKIRGTHQETNEYRLCRKQTQVAIELVHTDAV